MPDRSTPELRPRQAGGSNPPGGDALRRNNALRLNWLSTLAPCLSARRVVPQLLTALARLGDVVTRSGCKVLTRWRRGGLFDRVAPTPRALTRGDHSRGPAPLPRVRRLQHPAARSRRSRRGRG